MFRESNKGWFVCAILEQHKITFTNNLLKTDVVESCAKSLLDLLLKIWIKQFYATACSSIALMFQRANILDLQCAQQDAEIIAWLDRLNKTTALLIQQNSQAQPPHKLFAPWTKHKLTCIPDNDIFEQVSIWHASDHYSVLWGCCYALVWSISLLSRQ